MGMHSIDEHVKSFGGLGVRSYRPGRGIASPSKSCQRVAQNFEYGELPDDAIPFADLLDHFLAERKVGEVVGIVVGPWWDDAYEGDDTLSSAFVVERLAAARETLTGLRAIFLGDIIREENEITWIKQSDVTPLLEAFPDLEHLKVRGTGLEQRGRSGKKSKNARVRLDAVGHPNLRSLTFEAGCLPRDVVKAVAASEWPRLEHLELWLGDNWSSDCGPFGDATVNDLRPILSGAAFPALRSLAIRNSSISDAVAVALAKAPILERLEALDLSLGTLGDKGALALIKSGRLGNLKRIDVHHHYVSDEVLDGFRALGIALDAEGRREDEGADEEDRFIAIGE